MIVFIKAMKPLMIFYISYPIYKCVGLCFVFGFHILQKQQKPPIRYTSNNTKTLIFTYPNNNKTIKESDNYTISKGVFSLICPSHKLTYSL